MSSRTGLINTRVGIIALAVSLVAWSYFDDDPVEGVVQLHPKKAQGVISQQSHHADQPPFEPLEELQDRAQQAIGAEFSATLFRQVPVVKPVPSISAQVVSDVPQPPVFNFKVLGAKLENATWHVYLERDELAQVAAVGEVLDSVWRVDRIEPPSMRVTHVPTNMAISVHIGGAP